jgi:hypothetical protein
MKKLNVTGLVFLAVAAAACSIRVNTDGSSTPRSASPAPARPAAHPAAPAPAAPAPHAAARPGMRRIGAKPGVAHPAAAPAAAGTHHVSPGAMAHASEVLNVRRIQDAMKRNPKACGWIEPVPGHFTKIDCHAYSPALKAIAHRSLRKSKIGAHHQLSWKPVKIRAAALKGGLHGFSKGGAGGEKAGHGADGAGSVKADAFPGTVDHMAQRLEGPIKDQGPVGSCTAFSLSGTIDNQAIKAGKMAAGNRDQASAPNHVWSGYGIPQMGTAADANLGRKIATMAIWPQNNTEACKIANAEYETDCGYETRVQPGSWRSDPTLMGRYNAAESGGSYKIAAFEKLQTLPANPEELKTSLAAGNSLWIAMKIDGYAWSNSKMKNGVIPDWSYPNGGHAIEMVGYRETPQGTQYKIKNSWGTSWGDGGAAWVSENMVQKFMHYAYKVRLDGVPQEPGNLTDDDCAPDELVDLGTGLCGLICSGDNRPNNGCAAFGGK